MTSTLNVNNELNPWTDLNCDDADLQNLLDKPLDKVNNARLRDSAQHMGFDSSLGDSWIYPINLPCRSYQLSMVQASLYRNTLVVLPTGLGKTFIAAVVMYNIYRWYPRGKVIFMAPTRPLVNQQIEACQKIMPFPRKVTVELTGRIPKAKRTELWKSKRVFFATPQVVQSDILGGLVPAEEGESVLEDSTGIYKTEFPFEDIKLIVIDEAHKAKGKYAYTEVTQALAERNKYFRVLALSATPGRTMEDVAEVCRNLMISHIEIRWDSSIDVLPYVHKKHMETVVIPLGERIKEIREELLEIIDPYLRQLIECQVLSGSLANVNRNFLVFEQKRFHDRSLHHGRHPQHSTVVSNFAICISLYHALELLERHGTRVFLNYFEEDEDGKAKFVIQMERRLRELVDNLKQEVGPNPFDVSAGPMTNGEIADIPRDLDFGHPKFEKARMCLLKHFDINKESRAIVFCEYRESVLLIFRMLLQHKPLLRPRCFVGQGGTGTLRALTQKQQIQIMNDFRSGKSNILIATSIGEEGIDVGEVDLIVCFDISTSNPTRFVQRIGRTGRQKNGNVVMLVTEGREQQLLKDVLNNKDQINKKILRSSVVQQSLYKHAPRLVPTEFKPQCIQTFITPDKDDDEEDAKGKKSLAKLKNAKIKSSDKGTQDLRKFFNKKPQPQMDAEDLEYFEIDSKLTQAKPGIMTQQKMEKSLTGMANLFKDLQSPAPTQKKRKKESNNINQQDIIDPNVTIELCNDSPELTPERTPSKLKEGSIKNFFKDANTSGNMCQQSSLNTSENVNHISTPQLKKTKQNERWQKLKNIWDKQITTPALVKRAKINDLLHHLKSHDLSKDMKYFLLSQRSQVIDQNLEQINVLNALQDLDNIDQSEEEKSIKELYNEILNTFGSREKIETFLKANEVSECNRDFLKNDYSSEEESDNEDEGTFKQKLNGIFKDLTKENTKSSTSYEWVQQKFREIQSQKEIEKSKRQSIVQESMVYNTVVDNEEFEDDFTDNGLGENTLIDSKYCSQWQEFNKPDLAFKSTPLQNTMNKNFSMKNCSVLKKTSLLTKLEETKEENEEVERDQEINVKNKPQMFLELEPLSEANQCFNESNKFLESLKQCEKSLNSMLKERKEKAGEENETISPGNMAEESASSSDSYKTTGSLMVFDTEPDFISTRINEEANNKTLKNIKTTTDLPKISENLEEEDELFQAALEAELKFSQSETKKKIKSPENTKSDTNRETKTNDDSNSFKIDFNNDLNFSKENSLILKNLSSLCKISPPSLNSTPDIEDFQLKSSNQSKTKTYDNSLQQELNSKSNIQDCHIKPSNQAETKTSEIAAVQQELDVDMAVFMEPFPEEQELMKIANNSGQRFPELRRESLKENFVKDLYVRESPDLFAEEHKKSPQLVYVKPLPTTKASLASKLSTKLSIPTRSLSWHQSASASTATASSSSFKTASDLLNSGPSKIHLTSPTSRLSTDNLKTDKSPSVFDMFLKNAKGKLKMPKSLVNNSSNSIVTGRRNETTPSVICSQNDSPILARKRSSTAPKRKIFDSDTDESDESCHDQTAIVVQKEAEGKSDSDFEEVAATQVPDDSSFFHRRKRKRFNSFIEREAAQSGSDGSADEDEHTMGGYLLDSVIVQSDDNDEDQASTSHMQRMYLQSVRSPPNRRGAFKIPPKRTFNDHSRIFSQALGQEDICSQYIPDSFIVEEDDDNDNHNQTEKSMCPLEKAEQILRERRKARKRIRDLGSSDHTAAKQKRLKRVQINDSSEDDFD